jgi:hypothetical protein
METDGSNPSEVCRKALNDNITRDVAVTTHRAGPDGRLVGEGAHREADPFNHVAAQTQTEGLPLIRLPQRGDFCLAIGKPRLLHGDVESESACDRFVEETPCRRVVALGQNEESRDGLGVTPRESSL